MRLRDFLNWVGETSTLLVCLKAGKKLLSTFEARVQEVTATALREGEIIFYDSLPNDANLELGPIATGKLTEVRNWITDELNTLVNVAYHGGGAR